MKKTLSIREDRIFRQLYGKGRSLAFSTVVVYYRKNRRGLNYLGLTATKKLGNAVQRNRARRVMREAYRLTEDNLSAGYDIVLVARSATPFVPMDKVKKDLYAALKKAGIVTDEAAQ